MTVAWLVSAVVALGLLWLVIQVAVGFLVSPLTTGQAILKQKLKHYGVNVSLIPDAACRELVDGNLQHAKFLATLRQDENWRALFLQALEAEALFITKLMNGAADSVTGDPTRKTLVRHGVLRD